MLPWKTTGAVICFSETNFVALLGTAVVVSAAAAIWCTRRRAFTSSASIKATPLNPPTANTTTTTPAEVFDPNFSYLCTSCGTEKYTTSSPSNAAAMEQAKGPFKMIILVRTDLNLGKGKAAAQCCHAVLAAYKSASTRQAESLRRWEREGQPKVTLKIDSENEMMELMQKARSAGLIAESIRDAGRTQIVSGTRTVCAIGPAPAKLIDTITGHLKLF